MWLTLVGLGVASLVGLGVATLVGLGVATASCSSSHSNEKVNFMPMLLRGRYWFPNRCNL